MEIADSYAATDDEAADRFAERLADNQQDFVALPPLVPAPPRPGSPQPPGLEHNDGHLQ